MTKAPNRLPHWNLRLSLQSFSVFASKSLLIVATIELEVCLKDISFSLYLVPIAMVIFMVVIAIFIYVRRYKRDFLENQVIVR